MASRCGHGRRPAQGFTLLELMVVLAIVGLLAAVVLPQLHNVASSVETSNQRTDIKVAIEGLGYKAYATGQSIVLADAYGPDTAGAPFAVPQGWHVRVMQPVRYSVNGVCSGGRILLTGPDRTREAYELKPPQCRLDPIEVPQ